MAGIGTTEHGKLCAVPMNAVNQSATRSAVPMNAVNHYKNAVVFWIRWIPAFAGMTRVRRRDKGAQE